MNKYQKELFSYQDLKYQEFIKGLVPTKPLSYFIGVRSPIIRDIAKRIVKEENYNLFLDDLPHKYHEENLLHIFIINEIKDFDECINRLNEFVSYMDNWAITDSCKPKVFVKNKKKLLPYIKQYLKSDKPYVIREAINLLMSYYLDDDFDPKYLKMVSKIHSDEYYVNMMSAWYFATALSKQKEATLPYLQQYKLDKWVHNKTIQKAIESYRIEEKDKQYLRALKIK